MISNDYELLYETSIGNEVAFSQLFEKHRGKLYNYLVRITKSKEISEEIIIDVFMKIWVGKELLPDVKNFEAFLCIVAKNKAMDFFRIASREERLQKMVGKRIMQEHENQTDNIILEKEYQNILDQALSKLSPQRKQVFNLSREQGLTHDQIAKHLNLSRNTVRNTMADSLKLIRVFLKKNDIVPSILLFSLIVNQADKSFL